MTFLEYMRGIDPNYLSKEHQRNFVERLDELQRVEPCDKPHTGDTPPCHTAKCYSDKGKQLVISEQMRRDRDSRREP